MHLRGRDAKTPRAMAEVQARRRAVSPDAGFRVAEGEERRGISLDAVTNADESVCVCERVSDWLVDRSLPAGIPLQVIPLPQPLAAIAEAS